MKTITAENKYRIYVDDVKNQERLIVCEEYKMCTDRSLHGNRSLRLEAQVVVTNDGDCRKTVATSDLDLPCYARFTNGECYRIQKNFTVQQITKREFDKVAGFNQWTALLRVMQKNDARFLYGERGTLVLYEKNKFKRVGCSKLFWRLRVQKIINGNGYIIGMPTRKFYKEVNENLVEAIEIGRELGVIFGLIKEKS